MRMVDIGEYSISKQGLDTPDNGANSPAQDVKPNFRGKDAPASERDSCTNDFCRVESPKVQLKCELSESIDYASLYMQKLPSIIADREGYENLPDDSCAENEKTGFIFPKYEELIKEDEEYERLEGEKNCNDKDPHIEQNNKEFDDIFSSFLDEVESLPKTDVKTRRLAAAAAIEEKTISGAAAARTEKVVLQAFKNSDNECIRLTAQIFRNPFEVLLLTPDATDEDIRRQFRKLSLLIHPDKCTHEKSQEAFLIVNKAYQELQQPECRGRYRDVIEDAKKLVLKQRIKENKLRRGKEPLLTEDLNDMRLEIFEKCEEILKSRTEKQEYAQKTKQANEEYEREQQEKLIEEDKEKCRKRNEFLEKRDERVESWRHYQESIRQKEIYIQAFTGVRHVREERKDDDIIKKRRKATGVDDSYKRDWR